MRNTLVEMASNILRKDSNCYFLTADLGYAFLEPLQQKFPDRFINVGIAEANMIGVASGLSRSGKKVFCYSMIAFVTMRCLEQIRLHLSIGRQDINLIGVGAGFGYGVQGATHHAIEDIGVVTALPNIVVMSPGDNAEIRMCMAAAAASAEPTYIRLGKDEDYDLHASSSRLTPGRLAWLRPGRDATIVATGGVLRHCRDAAEILARENVSVAVVSAHTLKPFDREGLAEIARRTPVLATAEFNVREGGLGSIVATTIASDGLPVRRFRLLGIDQGHASTVASTAEHEARNGLSAEAIAQSIREMLE